MEKSIIDNSKKKTYIYGTGLWARNVYQSLLDKGVTLCGFLVTKREGNPTELFHLPVILFSELNNNDCNIVLGLNQHNATEVRTYIRQQGFPECNVFEISDIMHVNDSRIGYDEIPCIDVTTIVGCSVNCKYCPQNVFVKTYFRENKTRPSVLSKEIFGKCLKHLPQEAGIQFGGFAEPFLNKSCMELIRLACSDGRKVNIYTTLMGMAEENIEELLELPVDYITLHVADENDYAHIEKTEAYYHMLQTVVDAVRKDGKPLIDMCNAQAKPDQRVAEICRGKYEISYTLIDRAGNLHGDSLVSKQLTEGSIYCGVCGEALNKNEMLPDGTLLLCCMDYGMQHVLGNLSKDNYVDILNGQEMKRVRNDMKCATDHPVLCRKCSCANLSNEG